MGGLPLVGMLSRDWRKLRRRVGPLAPTERERVLQITVRSYVNDLLHWVERREFGEAIRRQYVQPPIIVLGLPRSGTTFLYQLLCQDPRFTFPTHSQVFNPHTFLTRDGWAKGPLAKIARGANWLCSRWAYRDFPRASLPDRGLDAIKISAVTPEEDEVASMQSGHSPILSALFPDDAERFWDFQSPVERMAWQENWLVFLKKISFCAPERRLVLKSPLHLLRISWILELFPEAQFVFISREPGVVLQSMMHMTSLLASWSLQSKGQGLNPSAAIDEMSTLYNGYLRGKELIPSRNLHELRYEELTADPISACETLYNSLGLSEFSLALGPIQSELEARKGYKVNAFAPLADADMDLLRGRLAHYYEAYNY